MLAKETVRHIVALMQGEDDIVIMIGEEVYDIAVIARGHIAGSEDMGVIITVAADDDDEEGDDDEYMEDEDDEGDDDEDYEIEDGVSPDLAERYIALGELAMVYTLDQLADFELRRLILKGWEDAKLELQGRIEARKRDRGLDPSLKYENGIYGKGAS